MVSSQSVVIVSPQVYQHHHSDRSNTERERYNLKSIAPGCQHPQGYMLRSLPLRVDVFRM